MSQEDQDREARIRAIIRRRDTSVRLTALVGLAVFAGLAAWLARSGRPGPPLSTALLTIFGLLSLMLVCDAFGSFRPIRYRGGALLARRSPIGAIRWSAGFVALGLAGVWAGLSAGGWSALLILPSAALIGLGAIRLPELVGRGVVLTVNAEGFFDRRFTRRPVAWREVTCLRSSGSRSHWPVLLAEDRPEHRTALRRLYCAVGFPYLYLDHGGLDRTGGDVLLAIAEHAPALTAELG